MKRLFSTIAVLVVMLWGGAFATQVQAQETAWIQLEAQPSLAEAQAAAQRYATQLQDVSGFRVNNGWYAIALGGPFTQAGATSKLTELRATGAVPRDAYVAFAGQYGQQFWPIGANTLGTAPPVDSGTAADPVPATAPPTEEVIPDETPPREPVRRNACWTAKPAWSCSAYCSSKGSTTRASTALSAPPAPAARWATIRPRWAMSPPAF